MYLKIPQWMLNTEGRRHSNSKSTALSLFLIFITCVTLLLCGCYRESNVDRGNREGILYWGNGPEPQELDPHITTGISEANIQQALFESLVSSDPQTLEPAPGVATHWNISADKTIYTFYLNPDARWSNGDRLTAQDFQWSLWRAMQPKLGNQYAYMYYPIRNAAAFIRGETDDFTKVGVKTLDNHTLQIELENPTPYFLNLLSHHSYFPVHRRTIETFGKPWTRGTRWTRPENMVSNGAFLLTEWRLFNLIAVKKNPYYHNAQHIELNGIHFIPTENITTEERMFRAGQLHYTYDIPTAKMPWYQQHSPGKLRNNPYLGTYFYRLNTTRPPLNDRRVRRALALAIDRQQIVERVTRQGEIASRTITPPGTGGYRTEPGPGWNPDQARALLAESGYPNGDGFPTLEVLYNTSENHRKIAVAIQQMWYRELNINVSLRNEDWKVFLDSLSRGDYFISRGSWIGDYVDPNTFLDLWISGGGNNRSGWSNSEFDRLVLEQSPQAKSQGERHALLARAESILLEDAPVIPIYTYASKHLLHPSVKGLYSNLLDKPFFNGIYLQGKNNTK